MSPYVFTRIHGNQSFAKSALQKAVFEKLTPVVFGVRIFSAQDKMLQLYAVKHPNQNYIDPSRDSFLAKLREMFDCIETHVCLK